MIGSIAHVAHKHFNGLHSVIRDHDEGNFLGPERIAANFVEADGYFGVAGFHVVTLTCEGREVKPNYNFSSSIQNLTPLFCTFPSH